MNVGGKSVKQDSHHTIGVEFGSKVVNVGGKSVKITDIFPLISVKQDYRSRVWG